MSRPETYTLTDLARFCGVSRQAVYKRLRTDEQLRTEVDTHTVNQDGKKVYTVDALEVLKQAIQATNCKPECKPDASKLTQQVYTLTQEVDRLTQQVDTERKKHETERKTLTTEIDTLTAERDRLRDQLDDAAADRETLITQMNQFSCAFCCCYSFALPLQDRFALKFCHCSKYRQHKAPLWCVGVQLLL